LEQLHLGIDSAQKSYTVHDPIFITVILRNPTDHDIVAELDLSHQNRQVAVYYRKIGNDFTKYHCGWHDQPSPSLILPSTLGPREEYGRELIVAFDTQRRKFVLEEGGTYELKVVYWLGTEAPSRKLESNTITIAVKRPSAGTRPAWKLYSTEEVARLVQRDSFKSSPEWYHTAIQKALRLAEAHPHSRYTAYLRQAQLARLREVGSTLYAWEEERKLYRILRDKAVKHQP
jgi:hypothetical protein